MESPRNVIIKIKYDPDGIDSLDELFSVMERDMPEAREFKTCLYPDDKLIKAFKAHFECDVQTGVVGGCYGARDGKTYEGLTVYLSAEELPDWYKDGNGNEVVNYWILLNEHGECLGRLEQHLTENCRENTYNYEGNVGSPFGIFSCNYSWIETNDAEGSVLASVAFHCGGDARGNYTDPYLFKFASIEDMHEALIPQVTEED